MTQFFKSSCRLQATFTFKNFTQALAFVNQVATIANKADHHPDILLHDYKKVTVTTTTHSQGNKLTDKDHHLARQIESLAAGKP